MKLQKEENEIMAKQTAGRNQLGDFYLFLCLYIANPSDAVKNSVNG